jgi:hypothetical protein
VLENVLDGLTCDDLDCALDLFVSMLELHLIAEGGRRPTSGILATVLKRD